MARKQFQHMDKILGPPPAPLVESSHEKKHGFFSHWKKRQPVIMHGPIRGPAGGYPADELSASERREFEQLKKHQLELAHKEDELAQLELDLKKYEKELRERFDVSASVDKARKEYGELSRRLELLAKQVQEKENLVRDLDAQFMLTDKEAKSKEKTLSAREKEFRKAAERFTSEKQEFEKTAAAAAAEKEHSTQWAQELAHKEKELHEKTAAAAAAEKERCAQWTQELAHKEKEFQKRQNELEKGISGQLKSTEQAARARKAQLLREKEILEGAARARKAQLLREKEILEGDIAALLKRRGAAIGEMKQALGAEEQKQRARIEKVLRGLSAERDRLLALVKKLKPQADQLRKQATPEFYTLAKQEKDIAAREEKCGLAEIRAKKMSDELTRREFEIGGKAAQLAQEEKELDAQQRALKERLDKENERIALMLTEKEALLKNKYRVLEGQLDRREHALHRGEKNHHREKGKLHLEFEQEREQLHAAIEEERQRLFGELQQQKGLLSSDLVELESQKRALEHAFIEKKETLSDLAETEKLLAEKEEHLLNRIKMLEADEHSLAAREEEIISRINELEKDKRLLDEKEDELIDVLKKLDLRENGLRMQERELGVTRQHLEEKERMISAQQRETEEKLELIKTNSALKHSTAGLENTAVRLVGEIEQLTKKKESAIRLAEISREIETLEKSKGLLAKELEKERDALEQEINKLVAKVSDMESVLMQGERVRQREDFVSRKEEALEQEHRQVQEQLNQLEENSTRAVAAMALADQQKAVTREIFEADSREKVEIYAMIEQARDAVMAGNYRLARQIYAAIQEAYRTFSLSDDDRHKIYFDVVELKTDIELGALM